MKKKGMPRRSFKKLKKEETENTNEEWVGHLKKSKIRENILRYIITCGMNVMGNGTPQDVTQLHKWW